MFRNLEVRISLLPESLFVGLPQGIRHAAVPRYRLQTRMAREGVLDKGVQRVPTQSAGAEGIALDGNEHVQVVVETMLYEVGHGGRLPLEQQPQALPFLRAGIREDADGER